MYLISCRSCDRWLAGFFGEAATDPGYDDTVGSGCLRILLSSSVVIWFRLGIVNTDGCERNKTKRWHLSLSLTSSLSWFLPSFRAATNWVSSSTIGWSSVFDSKY